MYSKLTNFVKVDTGLNIDTKVLLCIAAVLQIVWGFVPSASQFVINEIPIELYIALRWTISGFIFTAYLVLSGKWKIPPASDVLKVFILGVCGYGLGSFGTLYGLKIGGVTNFALMGAFNPMVTSTVAFLILKERPQKVFYLALVLCVFGLALLVHGKDEVSRPSIALTAAVLIIGAAVMEALVFTFSKRLKSSVGSFEYLAIAQIGAALVMWMLQFTVFHQTTALSNLTVRGLSAAIFVSVIACVCCYAILYWLLNYIDGHRLALFDGLHTLSAALFGWILFNEPLNRFMLIGGALLIAGLVIGNLPKKSSNLGVPIEAESL